MSAMMSAFAVDPEQYEELLREKLPTVIHTQEQNERYISELEELCTRKDLTAAEQELAELLTLLIEDFEEKHYQLTPATPIEAIQELMAANGLKQKDLIDVFGTRSVASEVLNGRRQLSETTHSEAQ